MDHVLPGEGFIDWDAPALALRPSSLVPPLLLEVMVMHSAEEPGRFLRLAYERGCGIVAAIRASAPVPFLRENVDCWPSLPCNVATLPEVIRRIIAEIECGLRPTSPMPVSALRHWAAIPAATSLSCRGSALRKST